MNVETPGSVDVAIIGGGIMGSAAAHYLAKGGLSVALVERGELNREASGANAGSLHFQIYMPPTDPVAWIKQIAPAIELHIQAERDWRSLDLELGTDVGVHLGGGLVVAETPEEVDLLRLKAREENRMGLASEVITSHEMQRLAPWLNPILAAADYCPSEGHANALLVAPAFARAAAERGARIHTNTEVLGIEPDRGSFVLTTARGRLRAHRVINAAGAWGGVVSRMVGLHLPLRTSVLSMQVTEPRPRLLSGTLVQHVRRGLTLKQADAGNFIVGGGWPGRYRGTRARMETMRESIAGNLWVATRTVPALAEARLIRSWASAGADPADYLPVIGESERVKGFYVLAASFGFTLGPTCARLLAEDLLTGDSSISLRSFGPDRF